MKMPQPIAYTRLYIGPLLLLVLIVALPLLARGQFAYLLALLQLCGIYALIVTGLTLLMGFTGQVSLGHAGFYGLGAYVAAVAATTFHAPLWLAITLALAAGAVGTFVVGFSILRLKGHYLALATLCVGIIIFQVLNKAEITGGAAGIYDVPEWRVFGLISGDLSRTYFIWALVVLVVLWAIHLTQSPVGRALRAIQHDEDAAESLGVNVFAVKLKVFIASGVLAALAGVLRATVYNPSYLGPEDFSLLLSVSLVIMVVVGGLGSVWGGLAGAVLLTGLHEVITLLGEKFGSTQVVRYEQLVYGLLLVLIVIYSRNGLMPGLRRAFQRKKRSGRKTDGALLAR